MSPTRAHRAFGIGETAELSLRVSVASLARVVFSDPEDGKSMLALEHKATLLPGEERVVVKAQPLGGAIRILNLHALQSLIGHFHFDSERSWSEQDFRLFIRPADWDVVREFCLRAFRQGEDSPLESDPSRELIEEFEDAMGIALRPEQYRVRQAKIVLENEPARTQNVHATDRPTVRIYQVFEARILDPALCRAMVANSANHSGEALRNLALADARKGGPGRANALLVAPVEEIRDAYLSIAPERRGGPAPFGDTLLGGNVPAVLEGVAAPKYRDIRFSRG